VSDASGTLPDSAADSLWEVIAADPSIPMDADILSLVIRDQRSRSRTALYPWIRVLSRLVVTLILVGKRVCPVRFSAHTTMDRLCLWFLRHFVSPAAVTLLIRHFIIETNLLNFCLRNSPHADCASGTSVTLRPTTIADLGNCAVIEHDLNVYRVLFALGSHGCSGEIGMPRQRNLANLDFGMLRIPAIDPEPRARRILRLDIQTALCLMNIPFAACLTPDEYRRAVHSLRLDATLLHMLAELTGDSTFLGWRPAGLQVRVDSSVDVPLLVYEHAVLCEYAHFRLGQLRAMSALRTKPGLIRKET
jgi:hypothetical protein